MAVADRNSLGLRYPTADQAREAQRRLDRARHAAGSPAVHAPEESGSVPGTQLDDAGESGGDLLAEVLGHAASVIPGEGALEPLSGSVDEPTSPLRHPAAEDEPELASAAVGYLSGDSGPTAPLPSRKGGRKLIWALVAINVLGVLAIVAFAILSNRNPGTSTDSTPRPVSESRLETPAGESAPELTVESD